MAALCKAMRVPVCRIEEALCKPLLHSGGSMQGYARACMSHGGPDRIERHMSHSRRIEAGASVAEQDAAAARSGSRVQKTLLVAQDVELILQRCIALAVELLQRSSSVCHAAALDQQALYRACCDTAAL